MFVNTLSSIVSENRFVSIVTSLGFSGDKTAINLAAKGAPGYSLIGQQ